VSAERLNGEPLVSRRRSREEKVPDVANGMKQDELKAGAIDFSA